jgi:hypothetical protein
MVLQLDRKRIVEEVGFLLIRADVVGPIFGKGVELSPVAIHYMVPMLKIQKLLHLCAK